MAPARHWTEETFIDNPLLFIPELLGRLENGDEEEEARQLKRIFGEYNVERFELSKSGKILFNQPEGTNDDRFKATALAL